MRGSDRAERLFRHAEARGAEGDRVARVEGDDVSLAVAVGLERLAERAPDHGHLAGPPGEDDRLGAGPPVATVEHPRDHLDGPSQQAARRLLELRARDGARADAHHARSEALRRAERVLGPARDLQKLIRHHAVAEALVVQTWDIGLSDGPLDDAPQRGGEVLPAQVGDALGEVLAVEVAGAARALLALGVGGERRGVEGAAAEVVHEHRAGAPAGVPPRQVLQRGGGRLHDGADDLDVAPVLERRPLDRAHQRPAVVGAEGDGIGERHEPGRGLALLEQALVRHAHHVLRDPRDGVAVREGPAAHLEALVDVALEHAHARRLVDAVPAQLPAHERVARDVPVVEEAARDAHLAAELGVHEGQLRAAQAPLVHVLHRRGVAVAVPKVKPHHVRHALPSRPPRAEPSRRGRGPLVARLPV